MRLFITGISAYIALIIYSFSAMAQESSSEKNLASPLVQWSVNKVFKENGFPTRECLMKTSFDNGLEISFKGKGSTLTALRVKDVSGAVTSKVGGFVGLGLGKSSYGLQSRSMRGQVDSSLLTVAHVADKIIAENMFRLKIGGQDYYFSAVGFEDGYDDLQTCLGRKDLKTLKVVDDSHRLPRPPMSDINIIMPAEPVDMVKTEPVEDKMMDGKDLASSAPEPLLLPDPEVIPENPVVTKTDAQWTATKGQKIAMVLGEWGAKEGVNVAVNLDNNPSVIMDFAFDGSFSDAVNKLINDNMEWVGTRPTAILKDDQGVETQLTGYKNEGHTQTVSSSVKYDPYRWRALEGTNLRKVLQQWAKREDVKFIWQADQTFLVRNSVKSTTEFPEAVSSLLAQYEDQKIRPVAQLNTDPATGEVSLIVKVLKSS